MKLRYYLRGLGIGMVVTALLMGIALKGEQPLSDAEIRLRAMALGMVDGDSRTLAGNQAAQGSEQEPSAAGSPEPTAAPSPDPTAVPIVTPIPVGTSSPEAGTDASKPLPMVTLKPQAETPEPTDAAPESVPESSESESVTFVVQRGQSSYGVAKALAEAGLIEDASAFDQYLESNGYSKRINAGTYEIPPDSTAEEIAKIITRSR